MFKHFLMKRSEISKTFQKQNIQNCLIHLLNYLILITSNKELIISQFLNYDLSVIYTINIEDRLGRNAFFSGCGVVYNNEYLIVHLYNHLLKIIKFPQSTEELLVEPITNICIEEQRIISLNTIQINNITLLAVHYEIKTGIKNVIFFTINLENMSI